MSAASSVSTGDAVRGAVVHVAPVVQTGGNSERKSGGHGGYGAVANAQHNNKLTVGDSASAGGSAIVVNAKTNEDQLSDDDMQEFAPYWHASPKPTCCDHIKTVLMCITFVPIRLLLVFLLILFYALVGWLCTLCAARDKPLSRCRHCVLQVTGRIVARMALFVLGFYYIPVTGRRDPKFRTIVSNHQSFLDILVFMSACFPAFVAKAGVLSVPFIGRLSRTFQCLYVAKHTDPNAPSATAAIMARQREMEQPNSLHPSLLVFAEGTTTNGAFVARFRTGAFRAGTAVQPAVVRLTGKSFVPGWDSIPLSVYLFRLLTQVYNCASVQFLPGHQPTPQQIADPALYAEAVRVKMAAAAQLPLATAKLESKWRLHKLIRSGKLQWKWFRNPGVTNPVEASQSARDAGLVPLLADV